APVDPESGRVHTHQVYVGPDGTVYDAMLNQTNIVLTRQFFRFYVIQLLHELSYNHTYLLYTRWGRVGEHGSNQFKARGPFPSEVAIGEFKKQFRAKTSVAWEMRVGMVAKKGKYTWLERDFSRDDEGSGPSGSNKPVSSAPAVESPTSKLAPEEIADVIDQPTGAAAQRYGGQREALLTLSGSYYSIIPHDFGRQRPLVIDDQSLLKRELELVDALGDMEVASKLISASTDGPGESVHPLDAGFISLGLTSFEPIPRGSTEWDALAAYARDTHGSTHSHLSVELNRCSESSGNASETEAWQNGGFDKLKAGERLLLWHGSRTTNFAGILKQGLRIAPPEAPVTGYMFGKGVYFADMMSKVCAADAGNNTGLLLLCEVAVKPSYELYNADYNADEGCRKAKKLATKGLGRTQPAKWKDAGKAMDNPALAGCLMPDGPGDDNADPKSYLQYNEIRAKYLLMVHM
ncbi:PARP-domain-containing protein, partial [Fistulina hepatica ATCC 64428]